MRVLITIKKSPARRYLIHLLNSSLVKEVRDLIMCQRHLEAMIVAFKKGAFQREVPEEEIKSIEADLILSDRNAMWDLTHPA